MIYSTGTIAINGNTVTGTGTNFTGANSLIRNGCTLISTSNPVQIFQITSINSSTQLTVIPSASPDIQAGTRYSILLSDNLSVDGLALNVAETLGMYQRNMSGFADVMNATGDVTITVNNQPLTVPGQKSLAKKSDLGTLANRNNAGYSELDSEYKQYAFAAGRRPLNSLGAGVWNFNNSPFGFAEQYGTCIQVSNSQQAAHQEGAGIWNHYLAFGTSGGLIYARNINGAGVTAVLVRTSGNTTVDSSGFIKQASPILRLTANVEEMPVGFTDGFELAGSGAVNDEARGASAERLDVGIYKITGSLGLSEDGWQIEGPRDINGNRLCFIEVEKKEDNSIIVRTYKPKLDLETGGIKAGEIIDIPPGRWIDLRLKMASDDKK